MPPQDDNQRQSFEAICRHIDTHPHDTLNLKTLSCMAGLSPGHFQRQFRAAIGLSPRQYQEASRLGQFKQGLRAGNQVTEAIYEAGFGSGSRVYEKLDTHLGMTPRQYRNGGRDLAISYALTSTRLGPLLMAATDRGLCFVQLGTSLNSPPPALLNALRTEFPHAHLSEMATDSQEPFNEWMQALEDHLAGRLQTLDLPLDIRGTVFQRKVWQYLQQIPYGTVQSYSQVAQDIGHPRAVRAVASACAGNNVAIVIPCHRVLRGSGKLAGYRWGLEIKRSLIDQEKRDTPTAHLSD